MKTFILVFCMIVGIIPYSLTSAQTENCEPSAVAEWMINRQVGHNQIIPLLNDTFNGSYMDALLLAQETRRNLEDLPRPKCADELYILTVYLYNGLGDFATLQISGGDVQQAQTILRSRFERYQSSIDPLYEQLESIANVDVMSAAAQINPAPVMIPTSKPIEPIQLNGDRGGVVEGPFDIPAGVYTVSLEANDSTSATLQSITGNCSFYLYTIPEATTSEEVFRTDGCRALIEIGMSSTPWTLYIEPIQ